MRNRVQKTGTSLRTGTESTLAKPENKYGEKWWLNVLCSTCRSPLGENCAPVTLAVRTPRKKRNSAPHRARVDLARDLGFAPKLP